ncbi:MAG: acyl-homoserine-lactone synthase [Sphingomicrobium sp.]
MVVVACGIEERLEHPLLRSMFRARKEVFADLLKWDVPVLAGEYEIDQFDDVHASYVVVTDDEGRHQASARLLPTLRPHILGNLFPELCASAVPIGDDVFEITRFCLDRNQNARERRLARNRLISGIVSFALERSIRTYTGVAESAWLQQILAFGWDCRPLGEPRLAGSTLIGGLSIAITPETPSLLAANGIWTPGPVGEAGLAAAA